jgi:hypothetical protein
MNWESSEDFKDADIRLECLRLAQSVVSVNADAGDWVKAANELYEWVVGAN